MTKLQKISLAAALVLAILTAFHQTKLARDARNESQLLRKQQSQFANEISNLQASLAEKESRLEDLLTENTRLKTNPNETELLKLRGEVTRLRPLQADVVALQKRLQESPTGLPTWKTNELANVGRADPLSALQTYIFSARQTNMAEIKNSIVGDDADPLSPEEFQKFVNEKNNHPTERDISGFRVLSETWLAPDKVQLELSASVGGEGMAFSVPFTLKNVNGEWKLVLFNTRGDDGKVNSIGFFNRGQ